MSRGETRGLAAQKEQLQPIGIIVDGENMSVRDIKLLKTAYDKSLTPDEMESRINKRFRRIKQRRPRWQRLGGRGDKLFKSPGTREFYSVKKAFLERCRRDVQESRKKSGQRGLHSYTSPHSPPCHA